MDFNTVTQMVSLPTEAPFETNKKMNYNTSTQVAPLQSNRTVADVASEYLIYKIGFAIHIYWLPIIVLVGLVGNNLALIIMLRKNNRRLSCCLYMAALAISDNVALLITGYYWTKPTFKIPIFHQLECSILGYLLIGSAQYGMLIIVAMTIDRFIAVRFSMSKARTSHCTPRRSKIMIGVLLVVAIVFNIPHLMLLDTGVNYTCITFSGKSIWVKLYALSSIILNAFIPFIALLVMNTIILKTIRSASKTFEKGTEFARIRGKTSANASDKEQQADREQRQLTIMLLLVNFAFLLFTMPVYVRYIIYTIIDYRTHPAILATYILVYHITHKLYYTNNAVNIFLYCLGGSKFRKELKQLFSNIKESVSSSDKTTSTASSTV